MKTHLRKR